MRKTMKEPLPPLRPLSEDDIETPRDSISLVMNGKNSHFNSDFEVNRSLFLTISQTSKSPIIRVKTKCMIPPKSSKPISDTRHSSSPTSNAPRNKQRLLPSEEESNFDKEINKISQKVHNENKDEKIQEPIVSESSVFIAPELLEIQSLTKRIPDPSDSDFTIDKIFRITPVLDRILSTVSGLSQTYISSILEDPIIQDLWNHLFALIDVDDFLLRTIVCRILLSFALDSSSPLLLPVSQIFYKLSCDQSNDVFFNEENIHEILMSIIKIASTEAGIFSAGALKNIAGNEQLREKLISSDFLNIFEDILKNGSSSDLKIQLIGTARRLCKSEHFRKPLIERNIIQNLFDDNSLKFELIKLCVTIPNIPLNIKQILMKIIQSEENIDQKIIEKFLLNLGQGLENDENYLHLLTQQIRKISSTSISSIENQETLSLLLYKAKDCIESNNVSESPKKAIEIFGEDDLFVNILNSNDADARVSIPAYAVIKHLTDPKFDQAKAEFSMFNTE